MPLVIRHESAHIDRIPAKFHDLWLIWRLQWRLWRFHRELAIKQRIAAYRQVFRWR